MNTTTTNSTAATLPQWFKALWWVLSVPLAVALTWLLNTVPQMQGLTDQGFLVYLESTIFFIAILFAIEGDGRVNRVMELLSTLGFLGTAIGFTVYLKAWDKNAADIAGLKLAFLTTAQALIFNTMLFLILLGRRAEDEDE